MNPDQDQGIDRTPGVGEPRMIQAEDCQQLLVSVTDQDARKMIGDIITSYLRDVPMEKIDDKTRKGFEFMVEGLKKPSTDFKAIETKRIQVMQASGNGGWLATPLMPHDID